MINSTKKAEIDNIFLWVAVILAVLIIAIWFIGFIGKQTLENQNKMFSALNTFKEYSEILCFAEEVNISAVEILVVSDSTIEVSSNSICIESAGFMRTCSNILCNLSLEKEFKIKDRGTFTFLKKNETIDITQKK